MRLGKRVPASDSEFSMLPRKEPNEFRDMLKIEDPIEISRNLNFALSKKSSRNIHDLITCACSALKRGGSLVDLLRSKRGIAVSNRTAVQNLFGNFRKYRVSAGPMAQSIITRSQTSEAKHRCLECFGCFPDMTSMQQHQQATNHSGSLILCPV